MKKLIPERDAALAQRYMELIRHKDFAAMEQRVDPSMAGPQLEEQLTDMAAVFPSPDEAPISVKPVALRYSWKPDAARSTTVSLEYEFPEEWVLAEVTTVADADGEAKLLGVRVKPMAESVERQNGFSLRNKGVPQYFTLFLALLTTALTVYSLVLCIRTRLGKWKWLWIPFILFGVGALTVNWTTGELSLQPFFVHLVPSGATALGYDPWMIYVSFPLGALIFLSYRDSLAARGRKKIR